MSKRLVCGVGVNDADYKTSLYKRIDGKTTRIWECPYRSTWVHMLTRCYSKKSLRERPSYTGCSVCTEWLMFSNFKAWMSRQDWKGKQLDKDILIPGNKVYSPATCAFVSRQLNQFFVDSAASRGDWPVGVHWNKNAGKFGAKCRNPFTGKPEHLGYHLSADSAHRAWRRRKYELACQYAATETDSRVAAALRARFAPQ